MTTGGEDVKAGCTNAKTTGDWCQTVPMTDAHGTPLGETIFVAASCCAHWPIGWCRQESVYLIEGVSNNATIYHDYNLAHTNYDMSLPIESTANITCMNGQWFVLLQPIISLFKQTGSTETLSRCSRTPPERIKLTKRNTTGRTMRIMDQVGALQVRLARRMMLDLEELSRHPSV